MQLKKVLKSVAKPCANFVATIGFDLKKLLSFRWLPKYVLQGIAYKKLGGKITNYYAILDDYDVQAGSASGHYFHQDLLVARYVNQANPTRHIDIGSRIDGFVAHVASFRRIEVMDVRELKSTGHKNISFIRADLMDENSAQPGIADSISCLHAIEHFGFGRYGDKIDPHGHIKGFNNILRMLQVGGVLYISFPIGFATATYFNAHRVFHPRDIFDWSYCGDNIELMQFDFVDDCGDLHENVDLNGFIFGGKYGCGIYSFKKMH